MATIKEILSKTLEERKNSIYNATKNGNIGTIKIDGNEFSGYGAFSFLWEKSYVKSPVRSGDGTIGNLNSYSTFLTPHLKIDFGLMSIDDYRRMMDLLYSKNEFVVECYDVVYNRVTTNKMYFSTEEMPKLFAIARKLNGEQDTWVELLAVQDYTVELVGTNADLDLLSIVYYYNADNTKTDKTVFKGDEDRYLGDEMIVGSNSTYPTNPPQNSIFSHWETKDGTKYDNGSVVRVNGNLELYAMWQSSTIDKLSFNYGLSEVETKIDQTTGELTYVYDKDVQEGKSIGTLPKITEPYVEDKETQIKYYPYTDGAWFKLPTRESTRVNDNDLYWTNRNSMIYCLFDKKYYDVIYVTNSDYTIPTQSVQYAETVYLPILAREGYTFKGWYIDSSFVKQFSDKMPPHKVTLYAKWVINE